MTNKNNITEMPYAQWLEQTLRDISELPVKGIALMGVLDGGESYAAYYNVSMTDKLVLAGLINQDATLDMLAAQGVIDYEDDDDNEEEDVDGEEEE